MAQITVAICWLKPCWLKLAFARAVPLAFLPTAREHGMAMAAALAGRRRAPPLPPQLAQAERTQKGLLLWLREKVVLLELVQRTWSPLVYQGTTAPSF